MSCYFWKLINPILFKYLFSTIPSPLWDSHYPCVRYTLRITCNSPYFSFGILHIMSLQTTFWIFTSDLSFISLILPPGR